MAQEGQHKAQVIIEGKTSDATAQVGKLSKKVSDLEDKIDKANTASRGFDKALSNAQKSARTMAEAAGSAGSSLQSFADRIRVDAVGALSMFKDAAEAAYRKVSELADESLRTRAVFDNLPFSIDAAARSTQGLVSNMDLATFAVQGARLKVFDSSKQFATFAEAATKLGMSAGIDATRGIESLVAGLGRGSTEMLDNLGVVLKTEEAHRRYAESLGKTASELTETEKAEAFRKIGIEAVIEAARDVTVTTDGAAGAVKRFNVELDNLKTEALGGKSPVTDLHEALAQLDNTVGINTKDLAAYRGNVYDVRQQLREMGVDTEVVAKLNAKDLVQSIESVRKEQFLYLDKLADGNRITDEHTAALERQLEVLDKTSTKYLLMSKALENLRIAQAHAAADMLVQHTLNVFGSDEAAEFANRQNEQAGLLGGRKGRGGGAAKSKTSIPDEFSPKAVQEMRIKAFVDGNARIAEEQAKQLEAEKAYEAAVQDAKLNEAFRGIERQRAAGVDTISLLNAEESALLEHQAWRETLAQSDAERAVLDDERKQIVHAANMARNAEVIEAERARALATEEAEARRIAAIEAQAAVVERTTEQAIGSMLAVSDARFSAEQAALAQGASETEAARAGALAAKQAVASQLRSLRDVAIKKALFETASGFAALAVGNFPGAGKHFIAAGLYGSVAVGAGVAARSITRDVTAEQRADVGRTGGAGSSNQSGGTPGASASGRQERRLPTSTQGSTPAANDGSLGATIIVQGDVYGVPKREFFQQVDKGLKNLSHAKRRVS